MHSISLFHVSKTWYYNEEDACHILKPGYVLFHLMVFASKCSQCVSLKQTTWKTPTHASYEYFKQKSLNRLMWGDGGGWTGGRKRARVVFGHCLEIGQRKGSGFYFSTITTVSSVSWKEYFFREVFKVAAINSFYHFFFFLSSLRYSCNTSLCMTNARVNMPPVIVGI